MHTMHAPSGFSGARRPACAAVLRKGLAPAGHPAPALRGPPPAPATLRFQEFDASFELGDDVRGALEGMLVSDSTCGVVAQEAQLPEGVAVEFTGMVFQPVPWSPTTRHGMPAQYEQYHADKDYVFINVPPQIMFKAKCFKPSRLCAIYKRK